LEAARQVTMKLREVEQKLSEAGVERVKIGGFDVDGVLRGKYVSLDKFLRSAEKGLGFCDVIFGWDSSDVLYDRSALTGWHTGYPDTLAKIDLGSMRVIPWEPRTAAFLLDFYADPETPHPASPRGLLKQVAARAEAAGYVLLAAAEYEFFVFRETPQSLHAKDFRDLQPMTPGMFGYSWLRESYAGDFVHDLLDKLKAFDIEIESFHTETGPGVWEAAIAYDELVRAADKAALFKTAVKELAHRHGLTATFMAKWNAALPGCGGHLHQSLWDAGRENNVFAGGGAGPGGVTDAMRWYIGGLLATLPDFAALYAPTVNSYKRLGHARMWAPSMATWGVENRTTAVRVIPGPGNAARVEARQCAADLNPYLALAGCVASGLHGLQNKVEPPPLVTGEPTDTSGVELPTSLPEATHRLHRSALARELLGGAFVDHYVMTRDWEARQFRKAVTDWELRRYFEIV
jgi:glutamine synthetase